jgi:cytochrome c biogenesis protein CcmG, thiol:disulfide interchange protein DsbE
MKNAWRIAAAGVLAAVTGAVLSAAGVPSAGRLAPDIRLRDGEGKVVALSSLRGKVVIVDFWASWCAPCRQSFPALTELQDLYGPRGLEVIAVNVDQQRRDADSFLAGRPRSLTVVFDQQGSTPKAFEVQGMPSSFVIGRDGTIRYTHVGFSDKVLEAYRREVSELLSEPAGGQRP